jgi:hypothetical protein
VVETLRKGIALLSVVLVLTAFRCMATCIASDAGASSHTSSSTTLPPCHRHHGPPPGTQNSVPCQNHPGLLAYTVQQPSAHIDLHLNLLAAVYERAPLHAGSWGFGVRGFAHTPPLPRPGVFSSIVLRI